MKKILTKLSKLIIAAIVKCLGQKRTNILLSYVISITSFPNYEDTLLLPIYQKIGILNFGDMRRTGELFALHHIAATYLKNKQKTVLFDVGAHTGKYSKLLRTLFSDADIYAFEPLPANFQLLKNSAAEHTINAINAGLGCRAERVKIYRSTDDTAGELATIYKSALEDLYDQKNICVTEVPIQTLDGFCGEHTIEHIDFLKIDVEGHELSVLQGAKTLLKNNKIDLIQFEFNEFNVFSRVFLKDFYDVLSNYRFYRIKRDSLIPILKYNAINEIFKYQNILAIRNGIRTGTE